MAALEQAEFSTAAFAPGWAYEHFDTSLPNLTDAAPATTMAKAVDRSVWEGLPLPIDVGCDCRKGKPHHTKEYQKHPILRHAREYPAGSSSYFHSDFAKAFIQDSNGIRSRLGSQSILPHIIADTRRESLCDDSFTQILYSCFEEDCLCIRGTSSARLKKGPELTAAHVPEGTAASHLETIRLCLFKLNMTCDGDVRAIIEMASAEISGTVGFYAAYQGIDCRKLEYLHHAISLRRPPTSKSRSTTRYMNINEIRLQAPGTEYQLVEFGVFCQGCYFEEQDQLLLTLRSLTIRPYDESDNSFCVKGVMVSRSGTGNDVEAQLVWRWEGSKEKWPTGIPWSATTGPFSHFAIFIDNKEVGTAHCLEFPLRDEDHEACADEEVAVSIRGHLFGGGIISSASTRFWRDELRPEVSDSTWYMVKQEEDGHMM